MIKINQFYSTKKDLVMIRHSSMVHGKCPVNGRWDYYQVDVETKEFLEVSELEEVLDFVRGTSKTQEEIAKNISMTLPYKCKITVVGRHSQNTETVVICD